MGEHEYEAAVAAFTCTRALRAVRWPALCRPRAPSPLMTAPRSRTMRSPAPGRDGTAKRRANDHSGHRLIRVDEGMR